MIHETTESPSFTAIAVASALVLSACGGATTEPEHAHRRDERGRHDEHPSHDEHRHHGGHGAHAHSSPAELRPLMNDLRGWLDDARTALDTGDLAALEGPARSIATACDDAELGELDPDLFGPRFTEIDRELHSAADALASAAASRDLRAARAGYGSVVGACVSCHAQAPSAVHVNLADLAPPEP